MATSTDDMTRTRLDLERFTPDPTWSTPKGNASIRQKKKPKRYVGRRRRTVADWPTYVLITMIVVGAVLFLGAGLAFAYEWWMHH